LSDKLRLKEAKIARNFKEGEGVKKNMPGAAVREVTKKTLGYYPSEKKKDKIAGAL